MANVNCSDLSNSITINITNTDLAPGFCHEDMDTTLDAFVATMSATVAGNAASFTSGDGEPIADDRNKLWFKQDGSTCSPLGWHWWNGTNTDWEAVAVPNDALTTQSGFTAGTFNKANVTVNNKGVVTGITAGASVTVDTVGPSGGNNGDFWYTHY